LRAIGVIIVMGIVNPYLALPTIVLVILFFKMKTIFMKTSQNVKRLEDVSEYLIYIYYKNNLKKNNNCYLNHLFELFI
jgi:ATP-binding cassette, subfamily C (CFTR/MRP), member 4